MAFRPGPTPAALHQGEVLYNTYCQSCHGYLGRGEGLGPPLLDSLFWAPRTPDSAFQAAVAQGVRQRHWHYGAMPPLPRVSASDVPPIVAYVRWLQGRVALPGAGSVAR